MVERSRWTTPEDIAARLKRAWESGSLLNQRLAPNPDLFPLEIKLRGPDARSLRENFEAVRTWIRDLENASRSHQTHGYDIVWSEVNHRQLGKNRVPSSVVIPDLDNALALLGTREQAKIFQQLEADTLRAFPQLTDWLARKPLLALEHHAAWPRILRVLEWLCAHTKPDLYIRQLEIPGVDSKFIENHKSLLSELLDCILPSDAVEPTAHPTREFETRYGLRTKPALVRFRVLDPTLRLQQLDDITTPTAQFAQLDLDITQVFFTENETNGLAFPACARSIVIFGLGYGLTRVAEIGWLQSKHIHYWGDIDTHGFAILDRLRARLPHAQSLLMDRETLEVHRSLWTHEASQHIGQLTNLTAAETALYEDLKLNRLGEGVRLEQERIAYAWVRQALRSISG